MKALAGTVGKILFWVFTVLVFFWTASLSLSALRVILPGDPIKPYIGLVLTDIGALCWLLVFIGQAQGLPQRAISLIMFLIDLSGVILLSAFELLTGGQTLAVVPAELGNAVIWGVIGLTLVNLAAAYFYHLAEPQTWKGIEFGVLTDRLQKEALQQAQLNVEKEAQTLGAILAARATAELKYNLRLPMSDFEQAEHARRDLPASKQIVDAQAADAEKDPGFLDKLFGKKLAPAPAIVTNEQTVVDVPKLKKTGLTGNEPWDYVDHDMPNALPCGHVRGCVNNWSTGGFDCAVCGLTIEKGPAYDSPNPNVPYRVPAGQPMPDKSKQPRENPPAGDAPFPGPKE